MTLVLVSGKFAVSWVMTPPSCPRAASTDAQVLSHGDVDLVVPVVGEQVRRMRGRC
jgi:hypothetical protein